MERETGDKERKLTDRGDNTQFAMMAERKLWIQVASNVITSGVFALDWRRGVYVHSTATVRTMTSLPTPAE